MKKNIIFDKNVQQQNGIDVNQVNATNIIVETVSQTGDLSINGNLSISNDLSIGTSTLYTSGLDLYLNNVLNCNGLFLSSSAFGISNNNASSTNILKGNYTYYNNVYLDGSTYAITQASSDNTTHVATTAYVKSQPVPSSFSGNISISGNLSVSGNVTATSFNSTSDRRIKDNILNINETIDLLKPRKYINRITNKQEFGFIADEIQKIFPNLVNGDFGGEILQSVNYIQVIPLLVKEIQYLKKEIDDLKNNK